MTAPRLETVEGHRAILVPVHGLVREVVLSTGDGTGLRDLQRHTGADTVTCTHVALGLDAWLDDVGAVSDPPRPINPRVTELAERLDAWPLRGDVVLTGRPDAAGDITSVTAAQVEAVRTRWSP